MPFAVYVPTAFADRLGELWWLVLEAVIARNERVGLVIDGEHQNFDCRSVADKRRSLQGALLVAAPPGARARNARRRARPRRALSGGHRRFCQDLCMSWQEIATLAADPLVAIGRIRSITRCCRSCRKTPYAPKWI